jgi:long-chain fatty acid transport protein
MEAFCRSLFLSVLCILFAAGSVQAGALALYEQATPDMGVAASGRQAAALDASTASGNPAGMTRLDRSQAEGGFIGFYPVTKFKVQEATYSGGGVGNAGTFAPGATLYYVHSLSPDLKLGLGTGSFMGAGLDYGDKWSGRYYAEKVDLTTLFINPTVGYRINPWLSVGGGVNFVYGEMSAKTAINTLGSDDGRLKYNASDVGYGFNAGVLFEVSPQTRIGITYFSEVQLNFKDEPKFNNISGTAIEALLQASGVVDSDLKVNWNIPQQVALGVYQEITQELVLVATVNWQDWSNLGGAEISVPADGSTASKDLQWRDTYHVGLGAYYRVAESWLLMVGWAYDTSPIKSTKDRSPALPVDRQFRYAAGVQYEWNKDMALGVAYTLIDGGDCKINRKEDVVTGDLEGKYDPNLIHAFNLNFVYRF